LPFFSSCPVVDVDLRRNIARRGADRKRETGNSTADGRPAAAIGRIAGEHGRHTEI